MTKYNETMFSSNPPAEVRKFEAKRKRYRLLIDNVELIGYPLIEDDPEFSEDSFEIYVVRLKDSHFTKESQRVYTCVSSLASAQTAHLPIKVELRYGTYRKEELADERSKKKPNEQR